MSYILHSLQVMNQKSTSIIENYKKSQVHLCKRNVSGIKRWNFDCVETFGMVIVI